MPLIQKKCKKDSVCFAAIKNCGCVVVHNIGLGKRLCHDDECDNINDGVSAVRRCWPHLISSQQTKSQLARNCI